MRRIIRIFAARLTQLQLFHVFFGVGDVVGCVPHCIFIFSSGVRFPFGVVCLAGAGGLDVLGGDAAPDLVRGYLGALQHQGASGDDGTLPHLAVVEQRGSHADEGAVVDGAGMYRDVVAYGHVAADMRGADVVGHMYA